MRPRPISARACTAALGDLDDDGDFDLLAGEDDGVFTYFNNTGSASAAVFVHSAAANPLAGSGRREQIRRRRSAISTATAIWTS